MDKLKMIKERHSVRTFQDKAIEPEKVQLIKDEIARVNEESGLHIQYIEDGDHAMSNMALKALGWKNVQFAIALVGPKGDQLDELCGYWGEHLVLFCQDLGINSCWAGMAKEKKVDAEILPGEQYVIAIGFGYGVNQGKFHKSRDFDQLCSARGDVPEWFKGGVYAAMLAPTAMNQQKFKLHLNGDGTVFAYAEHGFLTYVDLGIVKYHFEVGSQKDSSIWAAELDLNSDGTPLRERMKSNIWV